MANYTINFINNSGRPGSPCVYQNNSGAFDSNTLSLAWMVRNGAPGTTIVFTWNTNYSFVWAQTGVLRPGGVFNPAQQESADPGNTNNNSISLNQNEGSFAFSQSPWGGAPQGSLNLTCEVAVPVRWLSIGIGMSGSGIYACQGQPNMNFIFTPRPSYWLAFGNFQQGEALDVSSISNAV